MYMYIHVIFLKYEQNLYSLRHLPRRGLGNNLSKYSSIHTHTPYLMFTITFLALYNFNLFNSKHILDQASTSCFIFIAFPLSNTLSIKSIKSLSNYLMLSILFSTYFTALHIYIFYIFLYHIFYHITFYHILHTVQLYHLFYKLILILPSKQGTLNKHFETLILY